jgi:hypothetical protein
MAILLGYTIPAQFNKNWDHVYVASDGGHLWGCFGGDSGGIEICSGAGDIAFAYCLSYPRGKSPFGLPRYAGITYGKDGVCHQAANRILYPVGNGGLIVTQARGYGLSHTLFGPYGLSGMSWPELAKCASVHGRVGGSPSGGLTVAPGNDKSAQLAADIRRIHSHFGQDGLAAASAELEAFARLQLGKDYDPRKIAVVAECRNRWREEQQVATARLEYGELTADKYVVVLRELTSEMAARCERVLGDRDFERLFGIPPKDAADLLMPPNALV